MMMKAQLTFQYLISLIIFIGLAMFIYFLYSANIPKFIQEVEKEDIRSKAYQLSEVLVNDPGEPINWEQLPDNQIKRMGLSDTSFNKTNLISKAKIDRLDGECDDEYENVQEWLGFNHSFSLYIFSIDEDTGVRTLLLDCYPTTVLKGPVNATIRRIVVLNDTGNIALGEMILQV